MENRIKILRNAEILNNQTEAMIWQVIRLLENKGYLINENTSAMLITHLASMLKRSQEGKDIDRLDKEILNQVEEFPKIDTARELLCGIKKILPISSNEEGYILMHLCALLTKQAGAIKE